MATKEELNTAIDGVLVSVGSLATEQAAAFERLLAKIAAGGDFTDEVNKITTLNTQVQALIAASQAQQ